VTASVGDALRVEALGSQHDRSTFQCGEAALDRYFRSQAGQDARKRMAAVFVLIAPGEQIGGYYTLSATAVHMVDLPAQVARKLPRYPLAPATLLGRLAVDRRCQGKGYGRFLLIDALYRALRSEIASFAVVVDAKDEAAKRFYISESFLALPNLPLKLYRPMADIAALFGQATPPPVPLTDSG
jgi:GNAT superfamily N-acetyltransferase